MAASTQAVLSCQDLYGSSPEADPLDRFHPVLDLGVITVEGVEEPHLPGGGNPGRPWCAGMFVATIR